MAVLGSQERARLDDVYNVSSRSSMCSCSARGAIPVRPADP